MTIGGKSGEADWPRKGRGNVRRGKNGRDGGNFPAFPCKASSRIKEGQGETKSKRKRPRPGQKLAAAAPVGWLRGATSRRKKDISNYYSVPAWSPVSEG
uniref:Uncharacterized protein n=1 Tax=Vespula pensylvanica TaxID=30213 RepID=A0A834U9W3_VESPE|nr:hypothetical protein H0235_007490 [Vespula pensylvanica]